MENITANVQSLTGNLALDTIVSGLITLVVCYIAIRIVKAVVSKALNKAAKLEPPVKNLITKAVTFVLYAVAIIIVAGAFGINATSLVAMLSVVGLALSMSVQGLLSNFFSGILLLALVWIIEHAFLWYRLSDRPAGGRNSGGLARRFPRNRKQ